MQTQNYVVKSLELHLFFGRIMKEHSFFLMAGFTPADPSFISQAENFKNEFEDLLSQAVTLGDGIVSQRAIDSGQFVTEFTLLAEEQTEKFTSIALNQEITRRELRLQGGRQRNVTIEQFRQVQQLNRRALRLLDGLISFKETILRRVLACQMFTVNYPLLIEHILREARLYRDYVRMLENQGFLTDTFMRDAECFWNQIMMEHALFIRGLLDPTEKELIHTADHFAKEYSDLLEARNRAQRRTLTAESLEETLKFRDFKMAGTKGIEQCQIRSIILPLLADHVLREANHFILLLEE